MSNNVFVGNIPYDFTEEQLIDIFKQIGPVKGFRLVFDKETGRGKGYGFCEYLDPATAQSAVRNLDGYDLGNRQLRVAYADNAQNQNQNQHQHQAAAPVMQAPPVPPPQFAQQYASSVPINAQVPPLPAGTQPANGITATDAISRTLQVFPPLQLLEIIQQFKTLVQSNPEQAENLLKQSPPLSYAILQALLLMNLVDAQVLTKVISQGQPVQQSQSQPQPQPQYRQPTPQAQRQPTPQRDPNTQQLIAQVMSLTDAQLAGMSAEQQRSIQMIKQQVAAGLM